MTTRVARAIRRQFSSEVLPAIRLWAGLPSTGAWRTVRPSARGSAATSSPTPNPGLPADWDSYGSPPLSGIALIEACRLLVAAADRFGARAGERIGPYHVAPIPGGGVQLEWRGRDLDLEVHIGGDGETSWLLAEKRDGAERYREGRAADQDEILRLLGRVVKAAP